MVLLPGRHKLPAGFMEDHKRQRAIAAVAEITHELGITELTGVRIITAARMSRKTFYDLFDGKDGCLRLAFAEAYERIFEPVRAAAEGDARWLDKLRAVLDAFFAAVGEEPLLAELCLVHSLGAAGEGEGFDYQAGIETMTEAIQGGREAGLDALGDGYRDPPQQVEEFLARAIVSLTATRIRQGEARVLPGHRDELVQLTATPFFGIEQATRLGRRLEAA